MKKPLDQDRLGKILKLAKDGLPGERDNALAIVRKLCREHNLDFDALMADKPKKDLRVIRCGKERFDMCAQTIRRYGCDTHEEAENLHSDKKRTLVSFEATEARYIEVLYAYDILKKAYDKEREKIEFTFNTAFFVKHRLFYYGDDRPKEEIAEHQKLDAELAASMVRRMDEAPVLKALTR